MSTMFSRGARRLLLYSGSVSTTAVCVLSYDGFFSSYPSSVPSTNDERYYCEEMKTINNEDGVNNCKRTRRSRPTIHTPPPTPSTTTAAANASAYTYAHCLHYRPSNNLPDTNFQPNPLLIARTETERRKEEASVTIDDIESNGFEMQSLLGKGSFGRVYCARIISWENCINVNGAPICLPGDRVAIKRMSKLNLLRPIDLDDYNHVNESNYDSSNRTVSTNSTISITTPNDDNRTNSASSVDVAYRREMLALKQIGQHLHLCGLMGTFETKSAFYVVLELVEGPPLFDWIVEHGVFFREQTASSCLVQIILALKHIHARGVCHNDMKPENIIVGIQRKMDYLGDGNPDNMEGRSGGIGIEGDSGNLKNVTLNLKIIDFGMAHVLKKKTARSEQGDDDDEQDEYDDESIDVGPGEGTFAYWSPEMMKGEPYGRPADMWSLGVTLYIALCGIHPFDPKGVSTDQEIYNNVINGNYDKDGVIWTKHLSTEAKHVIERLLETDPKKRITAKNVLQMKWFENVIGVGDGGSSRSSSSSAEDEKTINEMSAIRNVLLHRTSQRLKAERREKDTQQKEKKSFWDSFGF
jgi:serine/threonine protein kinase